MSCTVFLSSLDSPRPLGGQQVEIFNQDPSRPLALPLPTHDASSPTVCTSSQSTPPGVSSLEAPSPNLSPPPLNQDQEQSQPQSNHMTLEGDCQSQGQVTKTSSEEKIEKEEEEHQLQKEGEEQQPTASPSMGVQQGEQENDREEVQVEPEPEEEQQQQQEEDDEEELEEPVSPVMELDPSLDLEVMQLMTSGSPPHTSLLHLPSPSPPPFTRRGKGRSLRPPPSTSSSCRPSDDLAIRLRQSPFSTEASPETSPAREPITPPPLSPLSPPRRETAPLAKVRRRKGESSTSLSLPMLKD